MSATGVAVGRGVGRVLVGAGVTPGAGVGGGVGGVGGVGAAVGGGTWMDWKGVGLGLRCSEKESDGSGGEGILPLCPCLLPSPRHKVLSTWCSNRTDCDSGIHSTNDKRDKIHFRATKRSSSK